MALSAIEAPKFTDGLFMRGHMRKEHMTQVYFAGLGLVVPPEPVLPIISYRKYIPEVKYDFLISPYSHSDIQGNKLWPLDRWQVVIDYLATKGSVGILGATTGVYGSVTCTYNQATPVFDQPLAEVANLIRLAKLVISIDNGISHLTSAVGSNHILLYPACLAPTWASNPRLNSITIQDIPANIQPWQVLESIDQMET